MLAHKLSLSEGPELIPDQPSAVPQVKETRGCRTTAGYIRCISCGEDRLIEWDDVLKVWCCAVCGRDWREVRRAGT